MIMGRKKYQSFTSRNIDDQRILESDSSKGIPGHTQPRLVVLSAIFPWWLFSIKVVNWNSLVLLLIKESLNLIGWESQHVLTNQKLVASGTTCSWGFSPCKEKMAWFFWEILIIKESCNLNGWNTQLYTPNQRSSLAC